MKRIVFGIDQSYKNTGLTILADRKVEYMGCIKEQQTHTDYRMELGEFLDNKIMDMIDKYGEGNNIMFITERIRLMSNGNLSQAYIQATGALVATIIDIAWQYGILVYSVDTRSWKSAIVGTSKPKENDYGIDPNKWPTILYVKEQGLLRNIIEPYTGSGKKGVINIKINGVKTSCKIIDDIADSYCIARYGFLPEQKQKLKIEEF